MGAYRHITSTFKSEYKERGDILKSRLVTWRSEPSVLRVEHPTNLARARELGYKAKQGVIVARIRIRKGLRKRAKPRGGRKPSKAGRFFAREASFQAIAEQRAASKFANCEVLNSYYVGEDGSFKFFEAILLDRNHPSVMNDKLYAQAASRKNKAYRALTSAGRKHRDSLHKP
ncbi:MAG: 50S ribosomal protein L15e [Candidatus Micrarchaeota archaeon]|nr:50S ribosomal protein L15e [Candidatus Micrarchaeota archaeon]